MREQWTRRRFLAAGGAALGISAWILPAITLLPADAWSAEERIHWRDIFITMPKGGHGVVKRLEVGAFANRRSLALSDRVESGEQLRVSADGDLIVSISDGTILEMHGGTVMDFSVGTNKTGFVRLAAGSCLAVVPKGHRYLLAGPTCAVGIKGTVIFRQVFGENVRTARAMGGRTVALPEGLHDYFCTCNGSVDYLRNEDQSIIASDSAQHHSSFFLNPRDPKLLNRYEMINHTDREIKALIDQQEGPQHDSSFLQL